MSFFVGIAGPWLVVAVLLVLSHRRAQDPTAGQWRSEPSAFFGGPVTDAQTPSAVKHDLADGSAPSGDRGPGAARGRPAQDEIPLPP